MNFILILMFIKAHDYKIFHRINSQALSTRTMTVN